MSNRPGRLLIFIEQLADFPKLESANLPASIVEKYGPHVRKLIVDPFLVVYEIDTTAEVVYILGLIHQRAAW